MLLPGLAGEIRATGRLHNSLAGQAQTKREVYMSMLTENESINLMVNDIAEDIAIQVVHHMDTMYPDMWKPVAKTARQSIKNTVIAQVVLYFGAPTNDGDKP